MVDCGVPHLPYAQARTTMYLVVTTSETIQQNPKTVGQLRCQACRLCSMTSHLLVAYLFIMHEVGQAAGKCMSGSNWLRP